MSNVPHHISRQFDNELETIRSDVLAMGGLAEQQFSDALEALIELNVSRAEKVMENEDSLNSLEVSIDEECVMLLARRQPAAGDLRFVIAVIKTITDLERIGDEADKIAKMTISLADKSGPAVPLCRDKHHGCFRKGHGARRVECVCPHGQPGSPGNSPERAGI